MNNADVDRTLALVDEACNALQALLGHWVEMAEADNEVPEEVITWLRAQRNKFAARHEQHATLEA